MIGSLPWGWETEDLLEKLSAEERCDRWMRHFNNHCDIVQERVIHDIKAMFHAAFPTRYYAFLIQRPRVDSEPWAAIYKDPLLAHKAQYRVSPVKEILF